MSIEINYIDCAASDKGTGTISCEIPVGVPTGFITVPKGWSLAVSSDFDTDYIKGQIKAKNFVPYLNSIDYEPANEEAGIFTTSTKVKLKTVAGLPGFAFHFSKGYHFHAAAYARNSFDDVDVLLVYANGVVFAARNAAATEIKGHTVGMLDTDILMHPKGDEPQKTVIQFQLTDAYEYNTLGVLLDPVSQAFNMKSISGIVDANIEKVSNATTTVVVKITADANPKIGIKGLTDSEINVTGTSETISTMTYDSALDDGTYSIVFTDDVSGDYASLVFKLYDTGDSTNVVEVSNVLYEGNSE